MSTTRLFASAALLLALSTGHAMAQADSGRPEMIFLIDSSGGMSLSMSGAPTRCEAGPANNNRQPAQPANFYTKSKMMVVQDALGGASVEPLHWCIHDNRNGHVYGEDFSAFAFPHSRAMCCRSRVLDECQAWTPCGNDHGLPRNSDDATPLPTALSKEGFIPSNIDQFRFGIATFDGSARKGNPNDMASFGDEDHDVPELVSDSTPFAGGGIESPNMGIRAFDAINGRTIDGTKGLLLDPSREVVEEPASISNHNEYVMRELRRIVPIGPAPVAPALADLEAHFLERDGAEGSCRRRVVVLILGNHPSDYYGGQGCNADVECGAGTGGRCLEGLGGVRSCVYPDGYPYETSESVTMALAGLGVKVYVIGVGPRDPTLVAKVSSIAAAGAGEEEGVGWFWADTEDQLMHALNTIRSDVLVGRQGKSAPIVVNPTEADLNALDNPVGNRRPRLWSVSSYGEIPGQGDPAWFGVVAREEQVCEVDRDGGQSLQSNGVLDMAEVLAEDEGFQRRSFTGSRDGGPTQIVVGGGSPLFDEEARLSAGKRLTVEESFMNLDIAEPQEERDHKLRDAGLTLQGFFGERGLPNGPEGEKGVRQLGAVLDGELAVIPRPQSPFSSTAYKVFRNRYKDRITVLAVPANDGAIHFFRMYDGKELMTFVPGSAWKNIHQTVNVRTVDGPLVTADLPLCRTFNGNGNGACPAVGEANVKFRTILAGTMGQGGKNIFGLDASEIGMIPLDNALQTATLIKEDLGGFDPWNLNEEFVPALGHIHAKPLLTQVREGDRARAAIVTGCGADPTTGGEPDAARPGRCALVIEADTGRIIREFSARNNRGITGDLTSAMVGAPVAWPPGEESVAKLVYMGDERGRLWRIDMRNPAPLNWKMELAWPLEGEDVQGYTLGTTLESKPIVMTRGDGNPAVVFLTGAPGSAEELGLADVPEEGYAVSVSETRDADGDFVAQTNWVLPLGPGEHGVGDPVGVGTSVLFTTLARSPGEACGQAVGKLYGVKALEVNVDEDGQPQTRPLAAGRVSLVVPALPLSGGGKALALQLPPGRVAYGLTTARVPSCTGGPAAEQIVLNLADESQGASGDQVSADQVQVHTLGNAGIEARNLEGGVFAEATGTTLSVCLNCDADGVPQAKASQGRAAQGSFPTSVTYWGSSFAD